MVKNLADAAATLGASAKNAAEAVVDPVPPLSIAIVLPFHVPVTLPLHAIDPAASALVTVRASNVGESDVFNAWGRLNSVPTRLIPVPAVYVVSTELMLKVLEFCVIVVPPAPARINVPDTGLLPDVSRVVTVLVLTKLELIVI